MNASELYLKILNFEKYDRMLNWEFGYWGGTITRWYKEGLPKNFDLERAADFGETIFGPGLNYPLLGMGSSNTLMDRDVHTYFKFDDSILIPPINCWIYPKFKATILEEDDSKRKLIDEDGITKIVKKNADSMPFWLDWPVKDEKTWEKIREERFQFNFQERINKENIYINNKILEKTNPIHLLGAPVGFYGSLRYLFGEINLLYMYYDNPALVKKILKILTDFWINISEEILSKYEVKVASFWEDMSGKNGALIGPNIFREFMSPYYKRIIDFLKTKGVEHFIVDTDGNVEKLIPLFLEVGMTGMLPFERQAGNDLLEIRKKFPRLQMMGGFDKNVLSKGREDIDKELLNIKELIKLGGYIPYCDHLVPPNVSWQNYEYFRKKLIKILS